MESIFLSSVSLGILVEKEIVVRIEDKAKGDSTPSHPSSVASVVRSISNLTRETKTSELRETTSSLPSGKMLARPNVSEDCRKDLVAFFHGPPPPGNFMSIPDDASISSADGKWGVFKVFRKKRKRRKRRQPPLIRLPDSAVSARTTDGHRYIAISIPTNYSNVSNVPIQRPKIDNLARRSTFDPRRNTLKAVAEDHESSSTISIVTKSATQQEAITELAPPPRKVSLLSTVTSQASQEDISLKKGKELEKPENATVRPALLSPLISDRTSYITNRQSKSPLRDQTPQLEQQKTSESTEPGTDKVPRVIEIAPKKIKKPAQANESSTYDNRVAPQNDSKSTSKSAGRPRFLLANSSSALTLPVRTSSRRATLTFSERNEGVNIVNRQPMLLTANSDNDDGNERATGPCSSVAESLKTTESSPRLLKAQTATAYQSVPIVVRPPSHPEAESPLNLNFPTPPSNNSIRGNSSEHVELLSPPTVAKVVSNRKDRVRERKRKDMEKLKAQLRQVKAPVLGVPPGNDWPESPVLGRFGHNIGSSSSSRPYLTAKMSEIGPIRPGLHLKSPYLSPEAAIKKRHGRSASVPVMTSSSSPSPLESPMPWKGSTAYYRRREKQAEQDEKEAKVRREKYAAQALAEEAELRDKIAYQKLLRRYEKLKESRTKDMEKRLHRLERNGEVLMQSMVSLMDTLNRLLQDQHQNPLRRSATVRPTTSSAPRPRRRHRETVPGRAQSLRSIRSYDNLREILRTGLKQSATRLPRHSSPSPHPAEREGEGQGRKENDAMDTRVSESALEALQEHLRSQSDKIARGSGISSHSRASSNGHSSEVDSVEVMEPLMRELQEAARQPEMEGERTPFTETEIFNLF
ncbi:uncharacterized protein F4807DRAFT_457499 [Annulohypoxylon truncatum]|uniref:uncharacterized protein n=1 Tax=Annulohypoxylon truncatum TaxID=327061 RepID=UPI00200823B2|nr:uncharacterized protein F4807DRAFT_457499 [Annulohypoxylon truncatum]KAI1212702.1 hypothetical protein F4807DRAFT_457499 [Annulohypoxylon truncatum]